MARYREVAQALRRRIGPEFAVGDRLPTIAALQVQYDVRSLNTVRDALRVLSDEGLISVVHGRGSFVAAVPEPREPADVLDLLETPTGERNVLTARAADAGVSLLEYLRRVVHRHATTPSNAEIIARAIARTGAATASAVDALDRERAER